MGYDGSKIVPVRIPEPLLREIEAAMARVEYTREEGAHTMASWIREAIAAKLGTQRRARLQRARRREAKGNG